jgi:hypothetical protein
MYLITLFYNLFEIRMRLLFEILITACKLMSVKEHLYLLLLIFKQEKLFGRAWEGNLGSRRIFSDCLGGPQKKLLAGRYLPTRLKGIEPRRYAELSQLCIMQISKQIWRQRRVHCFA